MTALKIGMIGVGNIAPQYVRGCAQFPDDVQLIACADINMDKAQQFATDNGLQAMTIAELLASDVDIVLNLTIPKAHAEVSLQVIEAGKHVYAEKPLAIMLEDGQQVIDAAEKVGVRVGCAPDTFLGGGGQTARGLIDANAIGRPVAGTAFMMGRGPESWHPNPFFYYQPGGGPMLDMGPYYLTALVNLLGPVARVAAITGRGIEARTAGHDGVKGQTVPIDVQTHAAGTLEFASGAIVTVVMSFDIWRHSLPRIEVYGVDGSLRVPDPNTFGGEVHLWQPQNGNWDAITLTHRDDVGRGIGVVDMARAIQSGQPHRASGALAFHVLEVMLAFDQSSQTGQTVTINSSVAQPAALEPNRA